MTEARDHYLFAYFTSQNEPDGEQVRFGRSRGTDPLFWEPLADGTPFVRSDVGTTGARDPFLVRAAGLPGEQAAFYMIATDLRVAGHDDEGFWDEQQRHGSRSILVWESNDLVSWSPARLVEVAPSDAGNAWAPEAVFDELTQRYFVFWASALYPSGSDRGTLEYNRMLCASTADFREFTPAEVWLDAGRSVIDATVVRSGGEFFRFVKDERTPDSSTPASRYITLGRSLELRSTSWELVADGLGGPPEDSPDAPALAHGEGPIAVYSALADRWYLFIDEFGLRRYVPFESTSIDSARWTMCRDFELPAGASHGSILPITRDEWLRFGPEVPRLAP